MDDESARDLCSDSAGDLGEYIVGDASGRCGDVVPEETHAYAQDADRMVSGGAAGGGVGVGFGVGVGVESDGTAVDTAVDARAPFRDRDTAWRRRLQPPARVLCFLAASGVALGGIFAAPGCQTVLPIAVQAAIVACIEVVKSLFDTPIEQLPEGYIPCESFTWVIEGHEVKFCLYCNPSRQSEVFIQFDCSGKYYPMRLRRIEHAGAPDTPEGISIESIKCHERFLIDVQSTVAPFMSGLACTMRIPNDRVLPSLEHYGTLDVRVDDAPAPRDGDFAVDAGGVIELEGSFDEVAHYAMTCGVLALTFKDGESAWTVHANPAASAIAVFRDGEFHDARFLFAPMPTGGLGHP